MTVDWTKPVYFASDGDEVVALRFPNEGVYVDATDHVFVVIKRTRKGAWFERDSDKFTNTRPVLDWARVAVLAGPESATALKVQYGIRDGKPFAEVIE